MYLSRISPSYPKPDFMFWGCLGVLLVCLFGFWVRLDCWLLCSYYCLWWYSYHWTKIKSLSRLTVGAFLLSSVLMYYSQEQILWFALFSLCKETLEWRITFRVISIPWLFCNKIKGRGGVGEANLPTPTNDYLIPTIRGKEHNMESSGWADQ